MLKGYCVAQHLHEGLAEALTVRFTEHQEDNAEGSSGHLAIIHSVSDDILECDPAGIGHARFLLDGVVQNIHDGGNRFFDCFGGSQSGGGEDGQTQSSP
jgi:hypothetical protein